VIWAGAKNEPDLLLEEIRFTRLSAGKYNHCSSASSAWVKLKKAVPLTSLGLG
jgi:hypothetical protein